MSSKGLKTQRLITQKALQLFSVKGYFNTSISDILEATSLTKGGLYCHFKSKEDIFFAVYDEAVTIWRAIAFQGVSEVEDPLERIELSTMNILRDYLGAEIFEGGCFFVNMLVELSDQSDAMSRQIVKGMVGFSKLLQTWLREADRKRILKPDLDFREVADFIIIALNGAATFYISTRERIIWEQTISQLHFYIGQLRS
jgi:AcrR family transcriptional regulator